MFFRQLVKTYCLISLSLLFTTDIYAQSAPERINGIYASLAGDHAGLYVAQDLGLFRKYGLDVNLTYTAGAAQVIQTMMAGENQIATAGGSGVVDADFGGADLIAVAGMVNMPAFYIVVQPEVKTIQDLKGRAVGITRFGSSTDFTMRYILRKAGLEPDKDVPLLQLGGQPELAVAMEARRIFAARFRATYSVTIRSNKPSSSRLASIVHSWRIDRGLRPLRGAVTSQT